MFKLIPRLNYKYSLRDAAISISGLFRKNIDASALNKMFKNDNIYFVNHARTGIRIALNSLKLKPGSRVGVQAFNCYTVFSAIKRAGFEPVFIDINYNCQIDIDDLKSKKNRINALIVTHLFGIPADMDKVKRIASDIPIIEDCAHAFFSCYKKVIVGSLGDVGVFSIGKGKFPSIGEGGFVVVNNQEYVDIVKEQASNLSYNSIFKELKIVAVSLLLDLLHNPLLYGTITNPILKKIDIRKDFMGKYKCEERRILKTNLYLFLNKFNTYKDLSRNQKKNANLILNRMNAEKHVNDDHFDTKYCLNYFMLPFIDKLDREIVKRILKNNRVEIGSHFSKSFIWAKTFGMKDNDCSKTKDIADQIITYPTYTNEIKIP